MSYYSDDTVTLHHGNALEVLATLDAGSVDCIVTSPPYFGLRDYGVDGQHGAESSPAEYVETMRATFAEARRVLADDGTLWLNLGDSYASGSSNNGGYSSKSTLQGFTSEDTKGRRANEATAARRLELDRPAKNLLGIPWRVAFALQDDGWILRNDIIWAKPNPMPESVTDRLSNRHEYLFMFSKRQRYFFDLDPIREPLAYPEAADAGDAAFIGGSARRRGNVYGGARGGMNATPSEQQERRIPKGEPVGRHELGRNPGDVWKIATAPFPEAHFATFPIELPRRCIAAGCKPGGTVLDPYSGSGTTGAAAAQLGRRYVGIELNADYIDLSLRTRLAQGALFDGEASA